MYSSKKGDEYELCKPCSIFFLVLLMCSAFAHCTYFLGKRIFIVSTLYVSKKHQTNHLRIRFSVVILFFSFDVDMMVGCCKRKT